jgi:hypothetical protein
MVVFFGSESRSRHFHGILKEDMMIGDVNVRRFGLKGKGSKTMNSVT